MIPIPENVRQVLLQLVPASFINQIACYVFYDNHPGDEKKIDITLCSKLGDVREYYQREAVCSLNLKNDFELTDIRIIRNSRGQLFYFVSGGEQLWILSREENLKVKHKLDSVAKYEMTDLSYSGQSSLKITFKDNNIPFIFDDNYESYKCIDFSLPQDSDMTKESMPILTHLRRKLIEAKYSVKCNEKSYQDFLNIRQAVAFSIYKDIYHNLDDSIFKDIMKKLAATLNIHMQKPWIKSCNKKIIVVYSVCNKNKEPLNDVHILLHGTTKQSIEYKTLIFEKTDTPSFWTETKSFQLKPNTESAIVIVIDSEELKHNVVSKIKFNGVLMYKMFEKECILPIHDVKLSPMDTMGQDFDVLCSEPMDVNITLAILASTEKTNLMLRLIKSNMTDNSNLTLDLFCKYLQMEQVPNSNNIVIHRKSPYHMLNGLIIVLDNKSQKGDLMAISVYSRCSSQVLALIHYIHDAVPQQIVITTPTQNVAAKSEKVAICNETTSGDVQPEPNYLNYAKSMLNRTSLVIEYLDKSMICMNESKQSVVRNKIGSEIDLFAQGESSYQEFKEKMREEAANGVKMLYDDIETIIISDEIDYN